MLENISKTYQYQYLSCACVSLECKISIHKASLKIHRNPVKLVPRTKLEENDFTLRRSQLKTPTLPIPTYHPSEPRIFDTSHPAISGSRDSAQYPRKYQLCPRPQKIFPPGKSRYSPYSTEFASHLTPSWLSLRTVLRRSTRSTSYNTLGIFRRRATTTNNNNNNERSQPQPRSREVRMGGKRQFLADVDDAA